MKVLLLLCIFAPIAVFGYSVPNEVDQEFDVMNDVVNHVQDIHEEQRECIIKGAKKIAADHTELEWWFKDAFAFGKRYEEMAGECDQLDGDINKLKCLFKMLFYAVREVTRLLNALPEDQQYVFYELRDVIKHCIGQF